MGWETVQTKIVLPTDPRDFIWSGIPLSPGDLIILCRAYSTHRTCHLPQIWCLFYLYCPLSSPTSPLPKVEFYIQTTSPTRGWPKIKWLYVFQKWTFSLSKNKSTDKFVFNTTFRFFWNVTLGYYYYLCEYNLYACKISGIVYTDSCW